MPRIDRGRIGSVRKRVKTKTQLAILVAGELFLQRRQFCKRRIGIDRPVAVARGGAGRVLPVRRANAIALVAAALVAPAEIAAACRDRHVVPCCGRPCCDRRRISPDGRRPCRRGPFPLPSKRSRGGRSVVVTRFLRGRTFGRRRRIGVSGRALAGLCGIHCGGGRGDGVARGRDSPPRRLRPRRQRVRHHPANLLRCLRTAVMTRWRLRSWCGRRSSERPPGRQTSTSSGIDRRIGLGFSGSGFSRCGVAGGSRLGCFGQQARQGPLPLQPRRSRQARALPRPALPPARALARLRRLRARLQPQPQALRPAPARAKLPAARPPTARDRRRPAAP